MCGRTYCQYCGEELIHRDHRKFYESSSALGQILSRAGPKYIGVSDADAIIFKRTKKILRIIEQKNPDHTMGSSQKGILSLLSNIFDLAKDNGLLHKDSGVFVLLGMIQGATEGRRKCLFDGEQVLYNLHGEKIDAFQTEEQFFDWLDPYSKERRCL